MLDRLGVEHSEAKLLITDREFAGTIETAFGQTRHRPPVIDIDDPLYDGEGRRLGEFMASPGGLTV